VTHFILKKPVPFKETGFTVYVDFGMCPISACNVHDETPYGRNGGRGYNDGCNTHDDKPAGDILHNGDEPGYNKHGEPDSKPARKLGNKQAHNKPCDSRDNSYLRLHAHPAHLHLHENGFVHWLMLCWQLI